MDPKSASALVRHACKHPKFVEVFRHATAFDKASGDYKEIRLSPQEHVEKLKTLLEKSPHAFLERFGRLLVLRTWDC